MTKSYSKLSVESYKKIYLVEYSTRKGTTYLQKSYLENSPYNFPISFRISEKRWGRFSV